MVVAGRPLKVAVEFSVVEPQGGIHFVIPENPLANCSAAASVLAEEAAAAGANASAGGAAGKDASAGGGGVGDKPKGGTVVTMADRAAHLFSCGHENTSR